ncbi:MAG: glycosyltransferase family 2 protein [Actinomycetota bacterium]
MATVLPVYLVHWDAPEWCGSAARSLLASEGVEVRLTVIDNGQHRPEPLASFLPAGTPVVACGGNRGYTGGANAALDHWAAHHPTSALAVIGSHDLHVGPSTLADLVAAMEAHPRCGVMGPGLVAPKASSGGVAVGDRWLQVPLEGAPTLAVRDWANGTCLLLRRACVDEVGRFDERLGSYLEDVDFSLRARDQGWQVLVLTSAPAWGLGSVSERASTDKGVNTVLLAAKRRGLRGAGVWTTRLVGRSVLDGVGAVAPWRPAQARARSAARARDQARVLARLARDRRRLAAMAGGGPSGTGPGPLR